MTPSVLAQNPNGPPGAAGIRVPPSVSSIDFMRLEQLRGRDIIELDPTDVSRVFDGALRNPQRFQRDAIAAAANILRSAPGTPQAAIADAYATIVQYRLRPQVDRSLQQHLARIVAQYPFSPAVALLYQTICEDLIARGQHLAALELLGHAKKAAVNDQQRQWFTSYAEFIEKATTDRPALPGQDNPEGEEVPEDDAAGD
jgi:hypothetical protein